MPKTTRRGHEAERPSEIPPAGWRAILGRVWKEIAADHVTVVAAGVAFFGLLAVFPTIGVFVSVGGVILDPADIVSELETVVTLLPENAATIITDQIVSVAGSDGSTTGIAAALGIGVALYGAMRGVLTLIEGMNIAYDEEETRGVFVLYLTALLLTVVLLLAVVLTFAILVVLPGLAVLLGLPDWVERVIGWSKWPILGALTITGLSVLYRFGPSRRNPRWRWISPGSILATMLWLGGTLGFSLYVQNFGRYNETYGALGGVVVLLTWFWLSAFIVLCGAELNAEMEHQTRRDSTVGPDRPMGMRGAVKADTRPKGEA
ncbi:membrane protein [Poseidonocella pacifica]|uniref:Membrane protein n=1 Tax=Poseidonocella pacifica TaxID=871651 RepID=A0A1I0WPS6_9RHOB|nr:YihY/virulence factor BrkB family protein [Poseidonocella pacifica]SFA89983.1 membrane protein [Poseidonocella pacifica]